MKITRENYEQYFIDYLDGNLSDREIELLEAFLLAYPELRDELEGLERISLNPDSEIFIFKESLKKPDLSLPINENNFEDFCIASAEGDLNENLLYEFQQHFDNHPEDYNIYNIYKKLHLVPDYSDRYPSKEELKKTVQLYSKKLIYTAISVAAMIIMFYFIFYKPQRLFIRPDIQLTNQIEVETENPFKNDPDLLKTMNEENKLPVKRIESSHFQINTKINTDLDTKRINPVSFNEGIDEQNIKSELYAVSDLSIEINIPVLPEYKINIPEIKHESFIKGKKSPEKYLNEKEFTWQELTGRVFGNKEKPDLSVWDIADAGINGISRITGSRMYLDKMTDDEGKINKILFESKFISFYISTNR